MYPQLSLRSLLLKKQADSSSTRVSGDQLPLPSSNHTKVSILRGTQFVGVCRCYGINVSLTFQILDHESNCEVSVPCSQWSTAHKWVHSRSSIVAKDIPITNHEHRMVSTRHRKAESEQPRITVSSCQVRDILETKYCSYFP